MRTAIVHYWLLGMRGGERVVESLCDLYPDADIFTLFYDASAVSDKIRKHRVTASYLNPLRSFYRQLLPWMPSALESFDLRGYDLVISSDDALFGHPSFRYFGWGPRMWTWVLTMGLRPFQEMVFTGRPFTAEEMLACNFLNKVVARDELEAEVQKYALACARNRPVDSIFQQKVFFEVVKQFQGEYMGSLLSAAFESMGGSVRPDGGDFMLGDAIDAGLADAVNDNDAKFPPEFRLSKKNRKMKD